MIERTLNRVPALVLSLTLMAPLAPALAQTDRLPDSLISTIVLNDSQKQAIADFANAHIDALGADDKQAVAQARAAVVRPLGNENVSAATRLELSRVLAPRLEQLAKDSRQMVAINAIIVAGELATEPATQVLVTALSDQRPDVRFQAAYGLERTFESIQVSAAAIRADRVVSILETVRQRLGTEPDGLVVENLVQAAIEAGRINKQEFSQVPAAAVTTLAQGLGQAIKAQGAKAGDTNRIDAYIRAGGAVRDIIGRQRLPDATMRAAAELGGDLIAHAVRVIEQKGLSAELTELRRKYATLSGAGESLVLFVGSRLDATKNFATLNIANRVERATVAGDAEFAVTARSIVGANGLLTKAPFSFQSGRFLER